MESRLRTLVVWKRFRLNRVVVRVHRVESMRDRVESGLPRWRTLWRCKRAVVRSLQPGEGWTVGKKGFSNVNVNVQIGYNRLGRSR
jgi:hypothetical protein